MQIHVMVISLKVTTDTLIFLFSKWMGKYTSMLKFSFTIIQLTSAFTSCVILLISSIRGVEIIA